MTAAISTSGLGKDYGSGRGLFDLHLEVPESGVFGYLAVCRRNKLVDWKGERSHRPSTAAYRHAT